MKNKKNDEERSMWISTTLLFVLLLLALICVSFTQNDAVICFFAVLFLVDIVFECILLVKHLLSKTKKCAELGLVETNVIITCKTSKAVAFSVIVDDVKIGKIKSGGHLFVKLTKGVHTIRFKNIFSKSQLVSFEFSNDYIEIEYNPYKKEKITISPLTIGQIVHLYNQLTKYNKVTATKIRSQTHAYEPFTDEEMDAYDLLDDD